MIYVSYFTIIVNPITAMMLTHLIIRYEPLIRLGALARLSLAFMIVALFSQSAEHIHLVRQGESSTSLGWIFFMIGSHSFVWTTFWRSARNLHGKTVAQH